MKEYIERSEQESILKKRYYELAGMRPDFYAGYMTAFHIIEDDIPNAADVVEVRHAKWVKTCVPDIYQCSYCKMPTKMDELCDSETLRAFCPNCGCKMDREVEELNPVEKILKAKADWYRSLAPLPASVKSALLSGNWDEPKSITRPELPEPETVTYGGYVEVTELLALPDEVLIPFLTDIQEHCKRLNSYNHFANRFLKEE